MKPLTALSLFVFLLAACGPSVSAPEASPTAPFSAEATPDAYFRSDGNGEPRTVGYWLAWNSCAPDNRAETARANGGRAAGWVLVDDLLEDPGILVGELAVETCQQAVNLMQGLTIDGQQVSSDPAYPLASQLLVAQLNLAVRTEYCAAVADAVQAAQVLLLSYGFDGITALEMRADREPAQSLTGTLMDYNAGALCR